MLYRAIELPRLVPQSVDPKVYWRLEAVHPENVVETIEGKITRSKIDDILLNLAKEGDLYQEIYATGRANVVEDLMEVLRKWNDDKLSLLEN
jgi:hypothetical protein